MDSKGKGQDYQKQMKQEMDKQQEIEETKRLLLKEFVTPEGRERSKLLYSLYFIK